MNAVCGHCKVHVNDHPALLPHSVQIMQRRVTTPLQWHLWLATQPMVCNNLHLVHATETTILPSKSFDQRE